MIGIIEYHVLLIVFVLSNILLSREIDLDFFGFVFVMLSLLIPFMILTLG